MQTAPWRDKALNTALASWTELRHDTILYAKQTYTPGETSVPPPPDRGYVEPVPEFYNRLLALTRLTRVGLADMNVLDTGQQVRLVGLEGVLARLRAIAIAELEGIPLSEADYRYVEEFGYVLRPLLEGLSDQQGARTTLVADVHTDINSGRVLEEGVGHVRWIVTAYPLPDGATCLGAGPVFSYYEFKWPMNDRLTDEKWTEMLGSAGAPPAPDWCRSFVDPVTFFPEPGDDEDSDGLSDSWERSVCGELEAIDDPDSDPDEDGDTTAEESYAGTDPYDNRSCLRILDMVASESDARIRWKAVAGKRYRLSYSEDLRDWYLVGTPLAASGPVAEMSDPDAAACRTRFYRVNVIP